MKNVLAIFSGVVGIFFLHLLVFFVSDTYRDTFKSLKYDSYIPAETMVCDCDEHESEKEIIYEQIFDQYADIKQQLFDWYRKNMQKVANLFEKYGFIEEGMMDTHTPFALEYENTMTGFIRKDYQDQYIYFFPGMSFDTLRQTYQILGEQTQYFTINEIDYIADRAFFINNADTDEWVRLILQKDENIF